MFRVVVVEDDAKKVGLIRKTLLECPGVVEDAIEVCSDFVTAHRALGVTQFDLMVLDICLPKRFGADPSRLGGIEFLREVARERRSFLPFHVIGLTAYEDVVAESEHALGEHLWTLLKFDISSSEWAIRLGNHVKYLIDAKSRLRNVEREWDYDLGIVCAVDIELEQLLRLPMNWREENRKEDSSRYFLGEIQGRAQSFRVVATQSAEMGMTSTAVSAMKLIAGFTPRYLGSIGIAAGVRGRINLGDLIIADISWDYGSGKYINKTGHRQFLVDPSPLRLDPSLKQRFSRFRADGPLLDSIRKQWPGSERNNHILEAKVGPVASGAAVVADAEVTESILEHHRKLLGLEMETFAIFYAAAHAPIPRPLAFSIRAVSDFADSDKGDEFQAFAAFVSAQALYEFVCKYL